MNAVLHLNIYLFPMILLACIFVQMQRNVIKTTDNRLFQGLLLCSFIISGLELVIWIIEDLDIPQRDIMSAMLIIVYFFFVPLIPLLWLNYVYFHLKKVSLFRVSPILNMLLVIPLVAYYLLLLIASVHVLVFRMLPLEDVNEYLHGRLYDSPFLLAIVYVFFALCIIGREVMLEKVIAKKKQYAVLLFYIALPFVGVVIQLVYVKFWIALPATAIAELLVYLQIQRQEITLDALTGINNRRSFEDYLKNVLEQGPKGKPLYLFVMDLDDFKEINDTYGHAVGDEALIKTANLLGQFFQSAAGFVARFGGDEFCAIETCQNQQEAEELIKRLEAVFEEANGKSKEPYRIEVSMGYVCLWEEGVSQNELIARADEMMYQNKRRRKCI